MSRPKASEIPQDALPPPLFSILAFRKMAPAQSGLLADVIDSVFTPGTNSGLVSAMSYSFYGLFLVLLCMLFLTGGTNGHVWALLGLSLGLFVSIKWFVLLPAPPCCYEDGGARIGEVEAVERGADDDQRFLAQIAPVEEERRIERLSLEKAEREAAAALGDTGSGAGGDKGKTE